MKKVVLLSLVMATIAITAGCANGLPRNCFLRRWFCGKECEQPSTVYYAPDECSTCPPTCSSCETYGSPAILDAPIVSGSSCNSCATGTAMPGDQVGVPTFQPQPQNYK